MGSRAKGSQLYHSLEVRRVWLPWELAGKKQPARESKPSMAMFRWGGASCYPIPPVDFIQPRRQRRADQQVVMPATRRHAPAQELAWSGEDLVGARRQLMPIDARDVRSVVYVLLEPAAVDQPDEVPAELRLARAGKDKRLHDHAPRSAC